MQGEEGQFPLADNCYQFAERMLQAGKGCELFAIFGHRKAGKSIVAYLLEGKQLMDYSDIETKEKVVVNRSNCVQDYPVCINIKPKRAIIESFTLGSQVHEEVQQVVKLIYLEELMKLASKVSFIIVCEETCLTDIPAHLQSFLNFMGITNEERDSRIDAIKNHCFFFLTKTKQPRLSECLTEMAGLLSKTSNKNVGELIQFFVGNQGRCRQFCVKTPQNTFADDIIKAFSPQDKSTQLEAIISQSFLKKKLFAIDQSIGEQILDLFLSLSNILYWLIQYATSRDKNSRKNYEYLARTTFQTSKEKNNIESMIGKWAPECLSSVVFPISSAKKSNLSHLSECLMLLCLTFESACPIVHQQFKEIRLMILFCFSVRHWLNVGNKQKQQLRQLIQNFQAFFVKYKPKTKELRVPKKKPYELFREAIGQYCKNNFDAMSRCLSSIKQKQKQEGYDYFDVIFEMKLLLHLLDSLNEEMPLFIEELLELSLCLDSSFFLFGQYLQMALKGNILDYNSSMLLVQELLSRQRYAECAKIINNLIALSIEPEFSDRLFKLQRRVQAKKGQGYSDKTKIQGNSKSKSLNFSIQSINQKTKGHLSLQKWFKSDNFSHFFQK